ncbi:hypothetical protein ACQJ0O_22825 [Pseudomonas shirazensis]|uniref:hypothetical protein n=1 Tax=Pseudomonas shirazensis TaxID=2745494 RepID=UPI002984666B|nr:hypothetical protein [Pseudomonas putida]EKT4504772.1 hypothetical protein [Pseudomonas putida]
MNVKRRHPLPKGATEAQWVISMSDQGISKPDIVANFKKLCGPLLHKGQDVTDLAVSYWLGEKGEDDIEFLYTPRPYTQVAFGSKVSDGYLLTLQDDEGNKSDTLLRTPGLEESVVRKLISARTSELCHLAYKNEHEGYPWGYSCEGDSPVTQRTASSGISYADIHQMLV